MSIDKPSKPNFLSVVISVLAALFGVQSDKNRQRDFQQGNPLLFIAVGAFFVVLFVVSLALMVNWLVPG